MRKVDLFGSNSHFAFGKAGLNHYAVTKDREHMEGLVEKAEATQYNEAIIAEDLEASNING